MWWASRRSKIVPLAGGAGAIVSLIVPDEVPAKEPIPPEGAIEEAA